MCFSNEYNPHLLHSRWRRRRTYQRCSWKVNKEGECCTFASDGESKKNQMNRFKVKQMRDSLDALQDLHQLSLLVRSHAGEHGGSQRELQRPHVDRQKNYTQT